jgi:hypothetical protein
VTEAEWLKYTDPHAALQAVRRKASQRKLRLFAVACCRQVWQLLNAEHRSSVEVAERFADGAATVAELRAAHSIRFQPHQFTYPSTEAYTASFAGFQVTNGAAYDAAWITAQSAREALPSGKQSAVAQVHLLREIFGNPFRRAKFDPSWLTSDVVALARGIYDEKAFDRMPILADALQDAACDNDDVLNHCRDTSLTHVRGCWVVDLLLGKS